MAFPVFVHWREIKDCNAAAHALYLRHYSCRNLEPETRGFVGVGQKLVLMTPDQKAAFAWLYNTVERWDKQTGVQCSFFRNEGNTLSSDLIKEACVWAELKWPNQRFWTYVNPGKITSANPGYCYLRAGWKKCGTSQQGLIILERA